MAFKHENNLSFRTFALTIQANCTYLSVQPKPPFWNKNTRWTIDHFINTHYPFTPKPHPLFPSLPSLSQLNCSLVACQNRPPLPTFSPPRRKDITLYTTHFPKARQRGIIHRERVKLTSPPLCNGSERVALSHAHTQEPDPITS